MFSCKDQDSTDIEPVVEEEILITEVPDKEGDLGARPNLGSVAIRPGIHGPGIVKTGESNSYLMYVHPSNRKRHAKYRFLLYVSGNLVQEKIVTSPSIEVTFPSHVKGKNAGLFCNYFVERHNGNIGVIAVGSKNIKVE